MYAPNRNRPHALIVLSTVALVALILHATGLLQPLEDHALGWLQPLLQSARYLRPDSITGTLADVNALREQVKELQNQVAELNIARVRIRELENENTLLRQQLAYQQANPDFDILGAAVLQRHPDLARVVGQDPSNLARYIIIDQGSDAGVKTGMPVVTPQGLVGRVTATGTRWAKVLLITDATSAVNAVVQSTRATGVVQGDVNGNLTIKYLPQGQVVKIGDLILTSGMGGGFPKRLVIGQVTSVRKHDIELFQEAEVQPSVDFARLEFVLVLKRFTPADITHEPTPTPTAAPRSTPTRPAAPTP